MIIHASPLGLGSDLDRFHPCSTSIATAVLSLSFFSSGFRPPFNFFSFLPAAVCLRRNEYLRIAME
jgi:hypothetical protein